MPKYRGPDTRLPPTSESIACGLIKEAKAFFAKHPGLLTIERYSNHRYKKGRKEETPEAFIEAYRLIKKINLAAKRLLADGGKVPPYLGELTSYFNKLHLACGNPSHGSYKEVLARGSFDTPLEDKDGIIRIKDFIALRAAENICQFDSVSPQGNKMCKETGRLIPPPLKPVFCLNDGLCIGFEITTPMPLMERDLGWISTDYTINDVKKLATQGIILGMIQASVWRHTEVAEHIGKIQKSGRSIPGRWHVTLISEKTGIENIQAGALPSFACGKITFGYCDITNPDRNEAAEYRTHNAPQLQMTLHQYGAWLVNTVLNEVRGIIEKEHPLGHDRPVAGGRTGLNPAQYYLNPEISEFQK